MSRPRKRIIVLILSLLLVAAGIRGTAKILRVRNHLISLRSHLYALEAVDASDGLAGLAGMDLETLRTEMAGAHADLAALDAELGGLMPLTRHLGWVPRYGDDLQAAPDLLEIALGVTSAGSVALEAAGPILDADGTTSSLQARLTTALAEMDPALTQVAGDLDRVADARAQLNTAALSPRVGRLVERLDRYLPLLRPGVELARLAPQLLGFDAPKTYLILAQNDDELRATGGFISGVGVLRVSQGEVVALSFEDSYAVDTPDENDESPPAALSHTMWAGVWLLRDANWSPDFPTTAGVVRRMYEREHDTEVDGVIAVDQQALRLLVGAVGPIQPADFPEPVTGDNVIAQIRQSWAPPGEEITAEWWLHRKDFMNVIVAGILDSVETDPNPSDLARLAQAGWQALEQKHILISLEDPEAAEILAENGWDGALKPAAGDYLMLVDTNVGFNKVNPNVDAQVSYHVMLNDDGSAQATASIQHQNRSTRDVEKCVQEARYDATYTDMMNRCFWNYLRLYVPEGSQLVGATPHPTPAGSLYARESGAPPDTGAPDVGPPEKGKQVFGTFSVVPPQATEETRFDYALPAVAWQNGRQWEYNLLVQKQPGAPAYPVTIAVDLPTGANFIAAEPPPTAVTDAGVRYEITLTQDLQITVSYE